MTRPWDSVTFGFADDGGGEAFFIESVPTPDATGCTVPVTTAAKQPTHPTTRHRFVSAAAADTVAEIRP